MRDSLKVRPAVVDDMPSILDLIDEAAVWLAGKRTDQWARPWPDRESRDRRILNGLRNGDTWIVERDGAPIATVTFRKRGNRKLWRFLERRQPAVYLSRLIVRRDCAGLGIGEALVDWAGLRGRRDWRAKWVRIDVWTTNSALHNYYEKRGFQPRGVRQSAHRAKYPSAALFQKPTASIAATAAAWFSESPYGYAAQPPPRARGSVPRRWVGRHSPQPQPQPALLQRPPEERFPGQLHTDLGTLSTPRSTARAYATGRSRK
ncbi:MAG TPA: GNAT family N-acetyltransferase [Streptosporangiaceae bacterium]|nr:GNAT family N-acetyltransferase [Streptosporangiaceae bacterium]